MVATHPLHQERALPHSILLADKQLNVSVWDQEPRVVSLYKRQLSTFLARIASINLTPISGLDELIPASCQLLVVFPSVAGSDLVQWLMGVRQRLLRPDRVWVPVLICARIDFATLVELFAEIRGDNWYFDIISPEHLESSPIRIANLIRICEHLQELNRYQEGLSSLDAQVVALQQELQELRART